MFLRFFSICIGFMLMLSGAVHGAADSAASSDSVISLGSAASENFDVQYERIVYGLACAKSEDEWRQYLDDEKALSKVDVAQLEIPVRLKNNSYADVPVLHCAIAQGYFDVSVMLLMTFCCDANGRDDRSQVTPLIVLTRTSKFSADQRMELADLLIKCGADPRLESVRGISALQEAKTAKLPKPFGDLLRKQKSELDQQDRARTKRIAEKQAKDLLAELARPKKEKELKRKAAKVMALEAEKKAREEADPDEIFSIADLEKR